jgi:Ca2+-binding RTX toxin-like protein
VKITRLFSNAVSRIVVYGGPGNDTIQIDSRITIPAWLFGGDGNDTLTPGGGPSLVLGGGANDTLRGGNGRSILIGGRGSDLLQGGKGDAILISGNTDYDCNDLALAAVLADWNTADGYAARVANLTATLDASTVHDDGAADTLQRGTGANWLFADLAAANLLGAKKSKIRFV